MTRLSRLKLPRPTNFGNANRSHGDSRRQSQCQRLAERRKGRLCSHPDAPLLRFVRTASFGCTAEKAGRIFQCISEFMSDFGPYNQGLGRSIFFGAPLGTDEARAREKIHLSLARLSKAGSGWQVPTHG